LRIGLDRPEVVAMTIIGDIVFFAGLVVVLVGVAAVLVCGLVAFVRAWNAPPIDKDFPAEPKPRVGSPARSGAAVRELPQMRLDDQ
jgi:hypothetical protein